MTNAGYADSQYTLMVQTYWSPLPIGSGIRYSESGYTRQSTGGCGVWNADANWANNTALATFNNSVRNAVAQAGPDATRRSSTRRTRSSGTGSARTRSGCSRRRASRTGRAPARPTRPSGSTRSARRRRSSVRTSSRRTSTRTTGVSWRCGTACARRTTAARRAAAPALRAPGKNALGEPNMNFG